MQFGPPVTPPIIKQLLIANAALFVVFNILMQGAPLVYFGVTPRLVFNAGYLWQPFTYMWVHGSFWHVAMNMFALWMFGTPIAMAWGPKQFLRFYLICGVGAGFIIAGWPFVWAAMSGDPTSLLIPTVGASGAVFGILLAYSLTWPDRTIILFPIPIPIKAIYFIPIIFLLQLGGGPSNISHTGHLGGVIVGYFLLAREGRTGNVLSFAGLRYRIKRWRMRRKLQAVRNEDREWERRNRNDRTFH